MSEWEQVSMQSLQNRVKYFALPIVQDCSEELDLGGLFEQLATSDSAERLLDAGDLEMLDHYRYLGKSDEAFRKAQEILDNHCLAFININPEMRVKVQRGPCLPELNRGKWRSFLLKIQNDAGISPRLRSSIENTVGLEALTTGTLRVVVDATSGNACSLSGRRLEYKILRVFVGEAGKWELCLSFDVGQGSQDLGFRNEVPILFSAT